MSDMFRTKDGVPLRVMTRAEFCEQIGMARSTFYAMPTKPKYFILGDSTRRSSKRNIRIAREDALAWACAWPPAV